MTHTSQSTQNQFQTIVVPHVKGKAIILLKHDIEELILSLRQVKIYSRRYKKYYILFSWVLHRFYSFFIASSSCFMHVISSLWWYKLEYFNLVFLIFQVHFFACLLDFFTFHICLIIPSFPRTRLPAGGWRKFPLLLCK